MTSTTKETKTERLILNLTVQERHTLKEYSQKSNSASESDFVRKAVELFVVLYRLVVAGSEIVLRNEAKRQQHTIPIAKKWTRDSAAIPDRETPRRNFELKIEEVTKEAAFEMVKQDAAPSATRLVWFAVGTYAHVLEWEGKGFALMEQRGGKFLPVDRSLPVLALAQTDSAPNEGRALVAPPAGLVDSSVVKTLTVRTIDWVLKEWEGGPARPCRRWWLTTLNPLLCRRGNEVAVIMKRNLLFLNEYLTVFSSASPHDLNELVRAVRNKLAVRIKWDDFSEADQAALRKRLGEPRFAKLSQRVEQDAASVDASPVWLLILGVDLKGDADNGTKKIDFATLERALYVHPCWIREEGIDTGLGLQGSFVSDDADTERTGYLLEMSKDEHGDRKPVGAVEMNEIMLDDQLDLLSHCKPVCLIDYLEEALREETDSKQSQSLPSPSAGKPSAKSAKRQTV